MVQKDKNKCGKPAPAAKKNIARHDLTKQYEVIIRNTFEIQKAQR